MNDGTAFQKRRKLLSMLDEGLVMLHLDPRVDGVVVPGWLKDGPVLRLNLAYGFRLPALDVGAEGVYAVLSFNKQNFGCTLPWGAIFAMTFPDKGHQGMIWPESLPAELAAEARELERAEAEEPAETAIEETPEAATEPEPRPPAPPLFKVHDGGQARAEQVDAPSEEPPAVPPERKRPHLTLVKG